MGQYSVPILIIGVLVLIAVVVSWFLYPAWRSDPGGVTALVIAALIGVLAILNGLTDVLKNWKDLRKKEKVRDESPLKQVSLETLKERLGRGGRVSYINRGARQKNLLHGNSKVVITGQMKAGKTREALEVIQQAINDDMVNKDQVFEPGQTLRALDTSGFGEALRWDVDTGQRTLLFVDDLPMEILPKEEEKWSALLRRLDHRCPECYIVATARLDQLTPDQEKWLQKEDFHVVELKKLADEKVNDLVLAAGGVFGLQITEAARDVFVEASDGRPETTIIGMRRLADMGETEVDRELAEEIAKDSLEAAWRKVVSYLEGRYPGTKYWLDAIGAFHAAGVDRNISMVQAYALARWRRDQRTRWSRGKFLDEVLKKFKHYDIQVMNGVFEYPEVAVEGRISREAARKELENFLMDYRKWVRWPGMARFHPAREEQAWALFDLVMGLDHKDQAEEVIRLYDAALLRMQHGWYYNNRGYAYNEIKQYERAIPDLNKAIELDPKLAQAYNNRGNSYNGLGQYERAITDLNKAIELDPKLGQAYNNRGNSYSDLGQHERAIEDYDKAIELDPKYAAAYYNRGNAYHVLGQVERAIDDYDKAIELDPKYAYTYNNRGSAYDDLKQYERAIADYDKAIELDPKVAAVYNNRGWAYHNLKQYERAIADYDKAIELDPKYARAYNNRGYAYWNLGQYERAIEDYDKAIELDPKYASAYNNRGIAYRNLGQYERAIEDYDKAIELDPKDAYAYNNRGWAYYNQGQYERAIEDYDKAIELDPKYATAYNNRGNSYYGLKQYERAIEDYDKAIELDPKFAYAYNNRGLAYRNLGQYERAIEDYDKAIELDPKYAYAYSNRGIAYRNLGQYEQAIEDYDKAIELDPKDAGAHNLRGNAYNNLGQYERAIEDYDKAIELDPKYASAYYNKACYYGLQGMAGEAARWLREALERNLEETCKDAREDSNFDQVRESDEFKRLLEEFCAG